MNTRTICLVVLALILPQLASAQIATVDLSNPTNPVVAADVNPYIYGPDLPPDPTAIYVDELSLPTTSMVTSANYIGLAYVALLDEGVVLGTANLDFGQYLALEPQVITNDTAADSYTTYPPVSSYTPPANQPPLGATTNSGPFYFDFGTASSPVASGYVQVTEQTVYNAAAGYGWGDPSTVSSVYRTNVADALKCDFCSLTVDGTPFYLDLTNGAYIVSVLSGDIGSTSMSIRANGAAEGSISARAGQYSVKTFPVEITNGRLRLEFIGSACTINSVTVTPDTSPHLPTIFIAGDSTAAAYGAGLYPLTGWGDRLKNYLTTNMVVNDTAVAGTSSRSFIDVGFLDAIANQMHAGDYLLICFGINDRYSDTRHTDPETSFKGYLRRYVDTARAHGATPIFVAEQTMRTYDPYGRFYNNIGGYPQAMRELAPELNVPLIDLNQKSINVFDVVGPEATTNMFRDLAGNNTWTNYPNGFSDYIHFQDRGATVLGRQVVDSIRELNLPIAQYVAPQPVPLRRPPARASYQ